jgi:acetoin utilization deacetylase AcuC-like enzyme
VDAVLDGAVDNAYALVRPPGHHADAGLGRGYCIFGNTAIAARHAQRARGLSRVAVVDFDVHHGNGTESAFYSDPSVLTISLHQEEHYPYGRGRTTDAGDGPGLGYNLNVPLPAGGGIAAYAHAFSEVVVPALEAFRPDLILVASGLDANWNDPSARMNLTPPCYAGLTRTLLDAAARLCEGRLVFIHEGGYSPMGVAYCGLAILEELTGHRTEVAYRGVIDGDPVSLPLHEHERAAVARAAKNLVHLREAASAAG